MSIEFHARPDHNLAVLVHTGRIPDDRFITFYRSFFESDTFDPSMNLLVDLRKTDSTPRSPEVLRQLAEVVRVSFSGITKRPRVAVVAPKDLSFGLARMYEAFANSVPWDFVVFRAMDAALEWLGLPDDLGDSPNQDAQ